MPKLILTSSFSTVANELYQKRFLPEEALIAFIPTAGNVYPSRPWIDADRKALFDLGYSVYDVELTGQSVEKLREALEAADVIFVAGGNTSYLFEQAHASGFDVVIKELLSKGKLYIGSSAGSILAGPSVEYCIEEDREDLPADFVLHNPTGLNLVDYVILPHYPGYQEQNDKLADKFSDRFRFVKLTDAEYKIES